MNQLCLFIVLGCACALTAVSAPMLGGRVLDVMNGPSVTILGGDNIPHIIRLYGVDTLPKTEPWGKKARERLEQMIVRKNVKVSWTKKSELGYPLGTIYLGKGNANLQLLKEGLAWHCTHFGKDPVYEKAEAEAKEAKRGMWKEPPELPDEAAHHPKPVEAATRATPKKKGK